MFRLPITLAAVALFAQAPAHAAERSVYVGSFGHVRVSGPFEVRIVAGATPRVTIEGDAAALDAVDVGAEGDVLHVRSASGGWGEARETRPAAPATVTLSTPALHAIAVSAGGHVVATGLSGARVDLSVNGAGALTVEGVDAEELSATVIGAGAITIAGKAARARLLTNGPGGMDAGALDAGDLVVRLDGTGETRARARYTARVTDTGTGHVAVAGEATCVVSAAVGGAVACGRTR